MHFPAHVGDLNEGKPRACAHRLDHANVHGRVHDDYGYGYGYGRGYALPDFQVCRGQNKMYHTTYNLQHLIQVQRRPGLQHGGERSGETAIAEWQDQDKKKKTNQHRTKNVDRRWAYNHDERSIF